MRLLELLAPARDAEVAMQAILHGADAVYMGGPSHGARAAASNSIEDIARVVEFAHQFRARVFVTLNTLVYDSVLAAVERLVRDYWRIGVDALIVQDMGLLRIDLPPIALHASTQCDIRTPEKAAFLAECGFSQLVLPREFSIEEIEAVRAAVPADVPLEAFVHGALCVSYSGDCQASFAANGRSANRGECAQMCRMAYDLVDGDGRVAKRGHLLSLRDLCRLPDLERLAAAGISSFKIEGRLKDAAYVKTVVGAYRKALDRIIANSAGQYGHASIGEARLSFAPDVNRAFNRGFTPYFLRPDQAGKMANFATPKSIGQRVGEVASVQGKSIVARLDEPLANGDGLGYFAPDGTFAGFRANRVEGNRIFPAKPVAVKPGTPLYRNRDAQLDALLAQSTARRVIPVDMQLRAGHGFIALRVSAHGGAACEARVDCQPDVARVPQLEPRRKVLAKLGGTIYELASLNDEIPADVLVPASILADLRRKAISLLDSTMRATYRYDMRCKENAGAKWPGHTPLTYHDNVANDLAAQFYLSHGATIAERAAETQPQSFLDGRVVMTTRYCLRRELGACLHTPEGARLKGPLTLTNRAATYRLDFDCRACRMQLIKP